MMVVGDGGVEGCLGSVGIGWRDMEWEVSLILKGVHRLGERHRYVRLVGICVGLVGGIL